MSNQITDTTLDGYLTDVRAYAIAYRARGGKASVLEIKDSPWVQYEDKAILCLMYSGNTNAYFEQELEQITIPPGKFQAETLGAVKNAGELFCTLASWAFARDVGSMIQTLDQEDKEKQLAERGTK